MLKPPQIKTVALCVSVFFFLNGCAVHYPLTTDIDRLKNLQDQYSNTLIYQIDRPDILTLGGPEKIEEVLESQKLFANTEKYSDKEPPEDGHYVLIRSEWRPPSLSAMIFGYLSISFATLLPAWSTKDGYDLYYDYFHDGTKIKTFQYRIKRIAGVWILILPFVWVNLLTNSEEDAFEAATYQFLNDVKPYLVETPVSG